MDNMPTLIWLCIAAILVASMQIGFMFVEAGFVRSKNSINVAMKNVVDFSIAFLAFILVGAALMFGSSGAGFIGWDSNLLGLNSISPNIIPMLVFQAMFCGTAATILSGAVAERVRFPAYLLIAVAVSTLVYPIVGHWIWGDTILGDQSAGWLQMRGFVDAAGSTVVHVTGGFAALAAIMVVGPRVGRYAEDTGDSQHIQGYSPVLAAAGAMILFTGWLGFNTGGLAPGSSEFSYALLNTAIASCAATLAATFLGYFRTGVFRTEYMINGLLSGLVAITASAPYTMPLMALLLGISAALLSLLCSEFVEKKLKLDDSVHAFSTHGAAGILGTIAVPLMARAGTFEIPLFKHLAVQIFGTFIAAGFAFSAVYAIASLLNRWSLLRVTTDEEVMGLNIVEHGTVLGTANLETVLKRLNGGDIDLSARVDFDPFDEGAELAHGFNDFLERVEKSERLARGKLLTEQAENEKIERDLLKKVGDQERERAEEINATLARFQSAFENQVHQLQNQALQLASQSEQLMVQSETSEDKASDANSIACEAAEIAQRVSQSTNELATTLRDMSLDMGSANQSVQTAAQASVKGRNAVSSLEKGAENIGKLVASINYIMRRTNILALNATIEAAHAGEYGESFGVVANEIRTLAQQTSGVSIEIQDIISNISGLIGEAVARFRVIDEEISGLTVITSEAQKSANQQASKGDQLGQLVKGAAELSVQAGHNVDLVAEQIGSTATSAENLGSTASVLKNIASDIETNFNVMQSKIRQN